MTMTPVSEYASEQPERSLSQDTESGYDSPGSSSGGLPVIYFSRPHLKYLNEQLQKLEPEGERCSLVSAYHSVFIY